jgi:uncharacterized small protein (DUF1192 family)
VSDEIINKKPTKDVLISESLYQLSLSDLIERIEFLENEIDRCKKEINNKKLSKNLAEMIFK